MSEKLVEPRPSILLFGEDPRSVETRQWVLQTAGYRMMPALEVVDLGRIDGPGKLVAAIHNIMSSVLSASA